MSCYCLFDILSVTDAVKMEDYRKRIGPVV